MDVTILAHERLCIIGIFIIVICDYVYWCTVYVYSVYGFKALFFHGLSYT